MASSGQVTIISKRVYEHYITEEQCLSSDVMTITLAPEQTTLIGVSEKKIFSHEDNEALKRALGSIKKKTYKDVKYNSENEARAAVRKEFEHAAMLKGATTGNFGNYTFPIPHCDMQKAFAVARAGYDVIITTDDKLNVEITAQSLASIAQSILRPKTKCKIA